MSAFDPLQTFGQRIMLRSMRRDKDRLRGAWGVSERRGNTLVEDMAILLGDLCKGAGFCSAFAHEVLAAGDPLTADAFATAVLRAEDWPDPEHEYVWRPQFVKLFNERYGAAISAADYKAPPTYT
jgi:hypothetical protein